MKLFKLVPNFNTRTGEKLEDIIEETDQLICDFTGVVIEDDPAIRPYYAIKVHQIGGSEETYYYDSAKDWFEKQGINYSSLWVDRPFHFVIDEMGKDATGNLVTEWINGYNKEDSIFFQVTTLDEALRKARIRTIQKLLEKKKFTPEELGLEREI